MQAFKLELFRKEYPGQELEFETLDAFQSGKVIGMLCSCFEWSYPTRRSLEFFKYAEEKCYSGEHLNLMELGNDDLESLLKSNGILEDESVYIIWDLETPVDRFKAGTLTKFWDDVWFDVSDDALFLFIPEKRIALFVTHYGLVGILSDSIKSK